jgi:hypothetical protein
MRQVQRQHRLGRRQPLLRLLPRGQHRLRPCHPGPPALGPPLVQEAVQRGVDAVQLVQQPVRRLARLQHHLQPCAAQRDVVPLRHQQRRGPAQGRVQLVQRLPQGGAALRRPAPAPQQAAQPVACHRGGAEQRQQRQQRPRLAPARQPVLTGGPGRGQFAGQAHPQQAGRQGVSRRACHPRICAGGLNGFSSCLKARRITRRSHYGRKRGPRNLVDDLHGRRMSLSKKNFGLEE